MGSTAPNTFKKTAHDRWANELGHVGCNATIYVDGNSTIHGDATPGSSASVVMEGNSEVSGSTVPAEEPYVLPELSFPAGSKSGNIFVSGNSGTLASGTYHVNKLRLNSNSKLVVTGPATIVVNDMELNSNSELIVDATNGPVTFYVEEDFILDSNTLLASTTWDPADIAVNLKANNVIQPGEEVELDPDVDLEMNSNSELYGTVFAPHAYIDIESNFELFGSIIARGLHIDSNARIHYDENLGESDDDEELQYEVVGWRSVTVQGGAN
ncbi:MAG: hypothetical protein P1V81_17760 [Planctomycetota bacterium]|nr:hypothetical protein [Planctomycetota bacterium]